jgi:hypothetical protein
MGPPLGEHNRGFRDRLRDARVVLTVIQRELDDLGQLG